MSTITPAENSVPNPATWSKRKIQLQKTTEQRFWEKVNKNGPVPLHMSHLGKCHEWCGATAKQNGYGVIKTDDPRKRQKYVHRYVWELVNGPIPEGMKILHHCDNRRCVNVESHLFMGTSLDNSRDRHLKGRDNFSKGDDHYMRKHPEKIIRGAQHHLAILTNEQAAEIKARLRRGDVQRRIAEDFHICDELVSLIKRGKRYIDA